MDQLNKMDLTCNEPRLCSSSSSSSSSSEIRKERNRASAKALRIRKREELDRHKKKNVRLLCEVKNLNYRMVYLYTEIDRLNEVVQMQAEMLKDQICNNKIEDIVTTDYDSAP